MSGIQQGGGIGFPFLGPLPKGVLPFNYQKITFNRDEFTKLLDDHGYPVTWEKAMECPNRKGLHPKDHKFTCNLCDNKGFIYVSPETTKALITGIKLNESFYAYGRFDASSVMMTFLPEYQVTQWDRVTVTEGTVISQQLICRAKTGNTDLLHFDAVAIEFIYWVNRLGALTLIPATEYSVSGHILTWLTTIRPDPQSFFSIRYRHKPRYVVESLPHQMRDQSTKTGRVVFPLQALSNLDVILRDESTQNREIEVKDPFSER